MKKLRLENPLHSNAGSTGARLRPGRSKAGHVGAKRVVEPKHFEPSAFAWTEPLPDPDPIVVEKEVLVEKKVIVEMPAKGDRVVVIGRGPSMATKLARALPTPSPVFAGAASLLVALIGVAMISPSGDSATAARSQTFGVASGGDARSVPGVTTETKELTSDGSGDAAGRDPFAARGFAERLAAKKKAAAKRKADREKGLSGETPAAARASLYSANFIAYSSYTPWTKLRRRSGGWIDFGGKPTVKVVSVSSDSVDLFIVSDVDVLSDKSRGMTYSYPLRTVTLHNGGIVRFADYRDIQGEDVVYTIRFRGSIPLDLAAQKR